MTTLISALGWTLLHSFWQLALIGFAAALLLRLADSPRARYAVACAALLACALWPALTLAQHLVAPVAFPAEAFATISTVTSAAAPDSMAPVALPWTLRVQCFLETRLVWITAAWALGAGVMALRLFGGWWELRRWRAESQPASAEWEATFRVLARRMGVSVRTALRTTLRLGTPVVVGLWRPVVLVPLALLSAMPEAYVEALLAHELAHVRRHDYLVNLLQSVLEVLCFHHPVVWWLSRRIRTEREHVADDLAVRGLLKDSADPGHATEARRCLALALDALDDALRRASNPEPNLSRLAIAAHGGTLLPRIARLLNPTLTARPVWGPGLLAALLIPCIALALRAATEAPVPIGVPSVLVAQIDALALKEGIDRDLLRAVAWAESRYRPEAKSAKGALGLLQVMPDTAQKYGAQDLADPAQVAAAGARYLKTLLDRYSGDVAKAVAAYNAGEAALDAGRITEEATRYQALVLALAGQRVIQPAAPQENGEVEGVLWTPPTPGPKGAATTITLKLRMRGNLNVEILPDGKGLDRGAINIGAKTSTANGEGTFAFSDKVQTEREPWSDSAPRIITKAYPLGTSVIIRAKTANESYVGEARVTLDAPLKTFKFRMVPKP